MGISATGRYAAADAFFAPSRDGLDVVEIVGTPEASTTVSTSGQINVVVASKTVKTKTYRWREGDRIDTVAFALLRDSRQYWRIMDLNPTLLDPTTLTPGALIVVPGV